MNARTDTADLTRPLLGVGLALVAVFLFALSDVMSKSLVTKYPVPVVVAVRYLVSLALLLLFVWPRVGARLWTANRPLLVLLRGLVLALASLTMGLALKLMPVGETIAILYLSPFAVLALAMTIFGEKVSALGWGLVVIGFCGALLILRPGGALNPVGVVWALLNAVCATVFHLMTRGLSRSESAVSMIFFVTLVGAAFFSVAAVPYLSGPLPQGVDLLAAAALGVMATGGHYVFSLSYAEAPASIIAPVNYFHLVWAAILGLVVFGHMPDAMTLGGMVLIFGSGVGVALTAHFTATRKTKV